MKYLHLTLLSLILFISSLTGQNHSDAMKPFYGFSSGNPLSSAIGHATVAAGQVIPDIGNNPANLGFHRFRNLSLGYSSGDFQGNTSPMSQDGVSNIQLIFPFPVYQGSLVAGFGYNREHEYAMTYSDENYELREEGNLHSYYTNLTFEYQKNLFIGLNLKLLRGYNDYIENYYDTTYLVQPVYHGFQMSIGVLQRVNPFLNIGFSIDFPELINIEESYTVSNPEWHESWDYEYSVNQAPVLHIGAAFFLSWFNLFYEAEYRNWSNLTFSSDMVDINGLDADIALNEEIEDALKPVLNHHFGTALHLPFLPLHLYGGFQLLPEPHSTIVRTGTSFGLSYMFQQQLSLNYSWQEQHWDYEGSKEQWSQSSLSLNLHF